MLTVVRGVLLPGDHRLRVEERPVRAVLHVVNDARLEIDVERSRDVLARGRLREESAEAIVIGRWRAFNKTAIRL